MGSGSHVLSLLAVPLNGALLKQLSDRPMRLAELHRDSDSAPQSTVRAHLKTMESDGVMTKRRTRRSPEAVHFELTPAGQDLLLVVAALERWLQLAPRGPLTIGGVAGSSAIKALEGGWSSMILGSLAGGAHSLSELGRSINSVSYPSLNRRLTAMRQAEQVKACPSEGRNIPYEVTEWLRQGVAPLAAAMCWERTYLADETASITRLDAETALLLALPLLRLDIALSGSCRMTVEIDDEEGPLCGVLAFIEHGLVVSSTTSIEGAADSWVAGSTAAWGRAMTPRSDDRLELGGDKVLAGSVLDGLSHLLFKDEAETAPQA